VPASRPGLGVIALAGNAGAQAKAVGVFVVASAFGFWARSQLGGPGRDGRWPMIDLRASALAGLVTIVAVIGAWLWDIARGRDGSPYGQIGAIGGVAYVVAVAPLRRRPLPLRGASVLLGALVSRAQERPVRAELTDLAPISHGQDRDARDGRRPTVGARGVADRLGHLLGGDAARHLAARGVDVLDRARMVGQRHLTAGFFTAVFALAFGWCWMNVSRSLQRFGISSRTSASRGVP
jgi:hypothetical protein